MTTVVRYCVLSTRQSTNCSPMQLARAVMAMRRAAAGCSWSGENWQVSTGTTNRLRRGTSAPGDRRQDEESVIVRHLALGCVHGVVVTRHLLSVEEELV